VKKGFYDKDTIDGAFEDTLRLHNVDVGNNIGGAYVGFF